MPPTTENAQLQYPCSIPGCNRWFKNQSGLTQHLHAKHPRISLSPTPSPVPSSPPRCPSVPPLQFPDSPNVQPSQLPSPEVPEQLYAEYLGPSNSIFRNYHPFLTGQPCDALGEFLPVGSPPASRERRPQDDWAPFHSRLQFKLADFLYTRNQMPAKQIDTLLDIWAESLCDVGGRPLFATHNDLYNTIDAIPLGDVKWQGFAVKYTGTNMPDDNGEAPWMEDAYDVWFCCPLQTIHNMLANPELKEKMDFRPYQEYDAQLGDRRFQDFMSGDWAWDQSDIIVQDNPECEGAAFVPLIMGSDKTTVSVATGQHDYYPLYLSLGNLHNTTREEAKTARFRKFRHQLFHVALSHILQGLKPYLERWEVVRCSDDHYRQVVYGLGPYIADYEEQALLACIVCNWCARCLGHRKNLDEGGLWRSRKHTDLLINELDTNILWEEFSIVGDLVPFTNDFPWADICRLLSPDILHQLIKGTFKDHLVDWVEKYLVLTHGQKQADVILDEIDRHIASVASFSGLRRFPQGCHFKQWTGDDSKALMKVYLAAIEGYVPRDMLRTFRAFLEFCYLVRKDIITKPDLVQLQDALSRFHQYHEVFKNAGVVQSFSLPRQHSLSHYFELIKQFGAPNGLCSSITESKHIKAVKMPYRRSSHHQALGQMLVINQRLDKLTSAQVDFQARGMLISRAGEAFNRSNILRVIVECNQTQRRLDEQHDARLMQENFLPPEETASRQEDPGDSEPVDDHRIDAFVQLAKTPQRHHAKTVAELAKELRIPHLPQLVSHLIPVFTVAPRLPSQGIHPHHSYNHFHLFYVNKFADHHAFTTAF
ncbi:hypothetical protein J3R83DRAFT_10225 [Lanmaoa asiatica]|nr:hypothetical protein J3R83DRAFT_10225 [Lanmaoa asiatica]